MRKIYTHIQKINNITSFLKAASHFTVRSRFLIPSPLSLGWWSSSPVLLLITSLSHEPHLSISQSSLRHMLCLGIADWAVIVTSIAKASQTVVGISSWDTEHWGSLAGSNVLLCRHRPRGLVFKGWAWEQRDLNLYTFASKLQKQKAKLNTHMAPCDFIGYFIPPVLCDLLHVSIL
jgi:hypothetical protein